MSTRINTNVTAFEAARNLSLNSDNLSKNIEHLSSGMRINSAADDAAGLVISQNMKAQLTGIDQATRNTNDAINMMKTAEGGLSEVQSLLMSMRQLAVHASNLGVNSAIDTQADQTQINSAISSIDRISKTTQFSSKKLLDGSATAATTTTSGNAAVSGNANFAIAAQGNWSAGNTYTYGSNTLSQASAATNSYSATGAALTSASQFSGSVTINGSSYNLSTNQQSSLTDLNTAIASSGYQASVSAGKLVFTSQTAGAQATPPTFDTTNLKVGDQDLVDFSSDTAGAAAGKATDTFAANVPGGVTPLTTANAVFGGKLTITNNVSAGGATTGSIDIKAGSTLAQMNTQLTASGLDVQATVSGGSLVFTSGAAGVSGDVTVVADTSSTSGTMFSASNKTTLTGASGSFTNGADSNLVLSDGAGTPHTLTSTSTTKVGSTSYYSFANGLVVSSAVAQSTTGTTALTGTITPTAGTSSKGTDLQFQIGADGGQTVSQNIASVASDQLGKNPASYTDANGTAQTVLTDSIKNINVSTFKGAQDAIAVIDKAISDISTIRANIGAFQTNVLTSNTRSLGIASQNLKASQSTIVDTDLSSEIVEYTKNQILVQAGTSALGQANQAPQAILKLLQ